MLHIPIKQRKFAEHLASAQGGQRARVAAANAEADFDLARRDHVGHLRVLAFVKNGLAGLKLQPRNSQNFGT